MSVSTLVDASNALPGRMSPIMDQNTHHVVYQRLLVGPYPASLQIIYFAMGCFWGAERLFWQQAGVWVTAVGYQGGFTPHPLYREVCTGRTGHAEAVCVVFDPDKIQLIDLLRLFWNNHDPTQGMRQGADQGTQYRSAIYWTSPKQEKMALQTRDLYQNQLTRAITTEICQASTFYFAESEHQQYLAKHPNGYCGLQGCGTKADFSPLCE